MLLTCTELLIFSSKMYKPFPNFKRSKVEKVAKNSVTSGNRVRIKSKKITYHGVGTKKKLNFQVKVDLSFSTSTPKRLKYPGVFNNIPKDENESIDMPGFKNNSFLPKDRFPWSSPKVDYDAENLDSDPLQDDLIDFNWSKVQDDFDNGEFKLKEKSSALTQVEQSKVASQFNWAAAGLSVSKSGWECKTCLCNNPENVTVCKACEEPKPGTNVKQAEVSSAPKLPEAPKVTTQFSWAAAGLSVSKSGWECKTCLCNNPENVTVCKACEEPKPGTNVKQAEVSSAPKLPEAPKVTTQFNWAAAGLSVSKSGWECKTCLCNNPENVAVCKACEEPKPGTNVKQAEVSAPKLPEAPKVTTQFNWAAFGSASTDGLSSKSENQLSEKNSPSISNSTLESPNL
jgi:hypothetical protein